MTAAALTLRDRTFAWGARTYIMGVLNITPDSFSDGGDYNALAAAVARAEQFVAAAVDILDVGGQSTRPGAAEISLADELDRVVPVIAALRAQFDTPISIDTTRAAVAEAAIAAGADLVNDISGGTFDPYMLATVARLQVPIVLMHLRGTPETMQRFTDYADLIGEIAEVLAQQRDRAIVAGIAPAAIVADPGIGFAKTSEQNLELLRQLPALRARLNLPLLVGSSRKGFIGKILDRSNPKDRVWGTAATCCAAIAGGADILRVHDVAEMSDVARVADAIWRPTQIH
ncbi:MAG: dihydropteroate synthase [Cyanobacteria bacterium J06641_5]